MDLQMRVSAPLVGTDLPIILLSHGHGQSNHLSSLNGYGPLANFWAAHGFVVIQPTHLSSRSLDFVNDPETYPEAPLFWQSRIEDMRCILDGLDTIESVVPTLSGRLDRGRIAVAGHSLGSHTAMMLLGMRLTAKGSDGLEVAVDLFEPRIHAGIILTGLGNGGEDLNEFAQKLLAFHRQPDWSNMKTPALVVVGDEDDPAHFTTRGPSWHTDPYVLSPGPKSLLTVYGGGHLLGGISGYDANETTDESPERVAVVQRLTWAYLRSVLYPDDSVWLTARAALADTQVLGRVDSKT